MRQLLMNTLYCGLPSGGYTNHVEMIVSRPFHRLLTSKKVALRKFYEARKTTTQKTSMAHEMESFNTAIKNVTTKFSKASFQNSDIIFLDLPTSSMNIAVHIKNINSVLRKKKSMETL